MKGVDVLGLACGGGQQGPVFAAAGANVTILDASRKQLERESFVAGREGLQIRTVLGDMADLRALPDSSFDLVFHPVSNCFAPDVLPVWREAFRVLRKGGRLLAGFNNPDVYIFDGPAQWKGDFHVKYPLPFDARRLSPEDMKHEFGDGNPIEFSHSLSELIGGQIAAGFVINGFYTDNGDSSPLGKFMPLYIATRAVKP